MTVKFQCSVKPIIRKKKNDNENLLSSKSFYKLRIDILDKPLGLIARSSHVYVVRTNVKYDKLNIKF